uniref:Uncharacterized protein n=1 Tax=Arundo donax TaxID=35708 RepID=A0A0A8Z2N7_ARUDO
MFTCQNIHLCLPCELLPPVIFVCHFDQMKSLFISLSPPVRTSNISDRME